MMQAKEQTLPYGTSGLVLDWGWRYDLTVWLLDFMAGGKLRILRTKALDRAELQEGSVVLDVGCGTGTLATEAYARVGETGRVAAIDPAPRQIARARAKAIRRGYNIDFQIGVVERLAYPDNTFDAVLSTWMMHHLPDALKREGLLEIARVLNPGGRLVVVDAEHAHHHRHGVYGHGVELGIGKMGIQDLPMLMADAGFERIEVETMRLTWLPGMARAGIAVGRKG